MKSFGRFAITFISGAAIGVFVGLLVAPKKGVKLQKELKDGIDDISDKVKDVAGALRKVAS